MPKFEPAEPEQAPPRTGAQTQRISTVWGDLTFEMVATPRAGDAPDAETPAVPAERAEAMAARHAPRGPRSNHSSTTTSDRPAAMVTSRPAATASGRPRADRAAQFMPFAALRGYYELIRQQERVVEPRHELTPEEAESLSQVVAQVRRGDIVRVCFYDNDAYVTRTGCVARIDLIYRELVVVKTSIALDDIRTLEIVERAETS